MTDYRELVKALRFCFTPAGKGCGYCPAYKSEKTGCCRIGLDAADAIEGLQADQKKTVTQIFCEEQMAWEGRCKDLMKHISDLQAEVKELRRLNMELFDDLPKYGERFFCWVSMDEDKPKHDGQYITYNTDGFIYWNWWDKFGWAYSASDVLYWMKIDPPTPKGFVKSKCQKCGKAMLTPAIVFDPEAVRICPNCGAKMMEVQE